MGMSQVPGHVGQPVAYAVTRDLLSPECASSTEPLGAEGRRGTSTAQSGVTIPYSEKEKQAWGSVSWLCSMRGSRSLDSLPGK